MTIISKNNFCLFLFLTLPAMQLSAEKETDMLVENELSTTTETHIDHSIDAQMNAALIKELQAEVISQLKMLQQEFAQLGFKLNKLTFKTKKSKTAAISYVKEAQEDIGQYIKKNSIATTIEDLAHTIVITKVIINQFEKTLKAELRTIPEIDSSLIKRSYDEITSLEALTQMLQSNGEKIATFSKKIATINLNFIQKAYISCAYKWNAPLLSIPTLDMHLYTSDIIKKIAVYGSITALAVHNLPEEQLQDITPSWLNTFLMKIKSYVGNASYAIKKSAETTYSVGSEYGEGYVNIADGKRYIKQEDNSYLCFDTMKKVSETVVFDSNFKPYKFAVYPKAAFNPVTQKPFNSDIMFLNEPTNGTPKITIGSAHDNATPSTGILGKFSESIGWIINPGIIGSLGFNLGIGSALAHYVYEDVATLKRVIPLLSHYLHARLTGDLKSLKSDVEIPDKTFDDVVGREGIKAQLQPFIDFIVNPKKMVDAGIKLPRGILLAGEPQTGKTFMVSAMAGELTKALKKSGQSQEVKLYTVPLDFLLEKGFTYLMQAAETLAPCIIFVDEFDMMQLQRTGNTKLLAEALTVLGGASANADLNKFVIFMVATNKPENIDYALRADGRISVKLYFENPGFADRKEYFTKFFTKMLIDTSSFNLDTLVQETENCSYGTIDTLCQSIVAMASQDNETVSQKHANKALNTCIKNIIYDGYDVPEDKRYAIAVRFAAKTLTSLLLHPEKEFVLSTILKKNNPIKEQMSWQNYDASSEINKGVSIGGVYCYNTTDTAGIVSNNELLKECLMHLAGTVGQQIVDLDYINYVEDEKLAYAIVLKIMQLENLLSTSLSGTPQETLPKEVKEQKLNQAYALIAECKKILRTMLTPYKQDLETIAYLLEEKQIIRKEDVLQILNITPKMYELQSCALDLHEILKNQSI